ncbi:unnamed protein product [Candidula unifasciata]|uniref:Uncharacterized protein n=1 Tax=Candidula unifasciata TaxID=100452 RepID=A0A8S3YHW1_9EUPU|nr:unnamed protein product [Candidula unifasciata]
MSTKTKQRVPGPEEPSPDNSWPAYFTLDSSATLKDPVQLQIQGTIPKWLTGSLYRNGSGVFKIGNTQFKHVFDGFAVLSRWTIKDGEVSFQSSVLDTESYRKSQKLNKIAGSAFGTYFPDPCRTIFNAHATSFFPLPVSAKDNTNVNIIKFADKFFALTESVVLQEVNPKSLLRNETIDIGESAVLHMGTAHPHVDPDDGNMIYVGTYLANYSKAFKFFRVPAKIPPGETNPFMTAQFIGSIESRWKIHIGYTHSFGLTKNYIVYFELPTAFNSLKVFTVGMSRDTIESTMKNYPDEPIKIHILNKITGERIPITYYAPHGFVFHFINCYEEDGCIICDVCLYDSGQVVKDFYLDEILNRQQNKIPFKGRFGRFVLPLRLNEVKNGENLVALPTSGAKATLRQNDKNVVDVLRDFTFFDDVYFDLPRINSEYNTRNYRYVYGCSIFNTDLARLVKFDLVTKQVLDWRCGDGHSPGEPVFVKSPNAEKEDDGVILSTIMARNASESSYLLVLDASTFKEIGRAVVPSSIKVNFSFHGDFYKNQLSDS